MELLKSLYWRHATKKMNGQTVPEAQVMQIVEAARLAPTSSGLQPFEIILIKNQQLKAQIFPIAYSQSQIVDSSHLLVFTAWDTYTDARMDRVFDCVESVRNMEKGSMDDYKNGLKTHFKALSPEQQFQHAARQAYIAFAMAIAAAAELKVDSSPMEGFVNADLDALLGLEQRGLKSVTLLALGYRDDQKDWLAPLKKVRLPLENILTVIE